LKILGFHTSESFKVCNVVLKTLRFYNYEGFKILGFQDFERLKILEFHTFESFTISRFIIFFFVEDFRVL